ncbi:hypothetical protein IB272_19785 [Ensifer sp. ENS08]|nr:hypothetical protein [Ensifer sp. ENS08]MBD9570802.1 hypothetical protein [Ensifer sp. ENS08]
MHLPSGIPPAPRTKRALRTFAAGVSIVSAISAAANAHDAEPSPGQPYGWSYPSACCSDYDCRMVTGHAVSEQPQGYVIVQTGETIGYEDGRIKQSPDGLYHWCSAAGAHDGRTICLFVPQRQF